jgi:hypothetical protein
MVAVFRQLIEAPRSNNVDEKIASLRTEVSAMKNDIMHEIGQKMETSNRELKDEMETRNREMKDNCLPFWMLYEDWQKRTDKS